MFYVTPPAQALGQRRTCCCSAGSLCTTGASRSRSRRAGRCASPSNRPRQCRATAPTGRRRAPLLAKPPEGPPQRLRRSPHQRSPSRPARDGAGAEPQASAACRAAAARTATHKPHEYDAPDKMDVRKIRVLFLYACIKYCVSTRASSIGASMKLDRCIRDLRSSIRMLACSYT